MELVRACAGQRVDHTARSKAIRCRVVAGDNRELLQRVDTDGDAGCAAGAGIGVIVGDDSIQAIAVLLRTSAGNGELRSEAAIAAAGCGSCIRLAANQSDTGLERSELRPVTAIKGKLARHLATDHTFKSGACRINVGRVGLDVHCGRDRAHRKLDVDLGPFTDGESDASPNGLAEPGRHDFDGVRTGDKIGRNVLAIMVGLRAAMKSLGEVGQGHRRPRQPAAGRISDRA
jgi:hypothetical protein